MVRAEVTQPRGGQRGYRHLSFAEIRERVPMEGSDLWLLFDGLPQEMQNAAWRDVRESAEQEARRR